MIIKYGNSSATLVPETGKLISLILNGKSIISNSEDYLGSGCYILFPWVNRIAEQQFQIADKDYVINPQFTDKNNIALHGYYANAPRNILNQNESSIELTPTVVVPEFPTFIESFRFVNQNEFQIITKVINPDQIPFGIGYHPYFNLSEQAKIETNLNQQLVVDEQLLPQSLDWKEWIPTRYNLDHCLTCEEVVKYIKIIEPEYQLIITSQMPYWQVYTPPDGLRIAIEPQSSTANQFVLETYKTDQEFIYSMSIKIDI